MFEIPTLPITIEVGYEIATVHLLILNPVRCFQCQRFGHTQQRCGSNLVCGNCESGHGEAPCPYPPHCENCNQTLPMTRPDVCFWVREPSKNFESRKASVSWRHKRSSLRAGQGQGLHPIQSFFTGFKEVRRVPGQ
jgi:hypothetical protein